MKLVESAQPIINDPWRATDKKFKANPKLKALYGYLKAKQKVKDIISHLVKEDGSVLENSEDYCHSHALGQFFQATFSEEILYQNFLKGLPADYLM